nr:MAG TPA: hypothetical protein [Caudoviricetes sp.]
MFILYTKWSLNIHNLLIILKNKAKKIRGFMPLESNDYLILFLITLY